MQNFIILIWKISNRIYFWCSGVVVVVIVLVFVFIKEPIAKENGMRIQKDRKQERVNVNVKSVRK